MCLSRCTALLLLALASTVQALDVKPLPQLTECGIAQISFDGASGETTIVAMDGTYVLFDLHKNVAVFGGRREALEAGRTQRAVLAL